MPNKKAGSKTMSHPFYPIVDNLIHKGMTSPHSNFQRAAALAMELDSKGKNYPISPVLLYKTTNHRCDSIAFAAALDFFMQIRYTLPKHPQMAIAVAVIRRYGHHHPGAGKTDAEGYTAF